MVSKGGASNQGDRDSKNCNEQPSSRRQMELDRARQLLESADELLSEVDEAFIFKEEKSRAYPQFDRSEIKFGPVLGVGGFGVVFEVKNIELSFPTEVSILADDDDEAVNGESSDDDKNHTSEHTDSPGLMEGPEGTGTAAKEELSTNGPVASVTSSGAIGATPLARRSDESQQTAATTTTIVAGEETENAANNNSKAAVVRTGGMNDHDDCHYQIDSARQHMVEHVRRNGDARYAVKRLHRDLSDLERARGMIDMAIEAKFLSALWHPNIVKMRGTASGPVLDTNFFIIMDRLYGTLTDKIGQWSKVQSRHKGNLFGMGGDKNQKKQLLVERLVVAYDLAAAFWYMHEKKLVYRDIKQENIGFDVRGDVKVFDFGLCKGLTPSLRNTKDALGGYNLTPRTGSVPYMAPEVAECKPYDCKADVFSFSILLWEMLSLKAAYKGYSRREFLERVVRGKERLSVNRNWPALTRLIVKEAWDNDPRARPDMKRVAAMLRGDLNDMSTDSKIRDRTQHLRERSAHSFRMARGLPGKSRKASSERKGMD